MDNELMKRVQDADGLGDDWSEATTVRKAGRYILFAACALGLGFLAFGLSKVAGFNSDVSSMVCNVTGLATFLGLREMSKPWDFALQFRSAALRARAHDGGDDEGR